MTRSLTGKVALVTGAAKGIGAGIAKAMAAAGASVVVNFASDRPGAERVVADIKAAGGNAFAIQANVSVVAEVEHLFAEAVATFGPLDILVNNASVFAFASLEQTTDEQLHKMLDTNLWGTIITCREALKHFGNNGGSIINIGSMSSERASATTLERNSTLARHRVVTDSGGKISPLSNFADEPFGVLAPLSEICIKTSDAPRPAR